MWRFYSNFLHKCIAQASGGNLSPSLGGRKFSRTKMTFLKKFPFSRQKFLTFFLVINQVFRIFPLFSLIFRILTLLDIVHNPFLARKTPFSHLAANIFFSHPTDTTSQNIGGNECIVNGCVLSPMLVNKRRNNTILLESVEYAAATSWQILTITFKWCLISVWIVN